VSVFVPFVLVKQASGGELDEPLALHCIAADELEQQQVSVCLLHQLRRCQYVYFCTSEASKLSTWSSWKKRRRGVDRKSRCCVNTCRTVPAPPTHTRSATSVFVLLYE
jgi:hypothetical protein